MARRIIRQSFDKMGVKAKKLLVERLTELGDAAIHHAFFQGHSDTPKTIVRSVDGKRQVVSDGKWRDRTGYLRDSFGSAVYINGELQEETIRYVDGSKSSGAGRYALKEYFNRIHPKKGTGEICLICVAAMYYTRFLEKGTHYGRYKIKVISGARAFVNRHLQEVMDSIYKKMEIKKPTTKVIKGDMFELKQDMI